MGIALALLGGLALLGLAVSQTLGPGGAPGGGGVPPDLPQRMEAFLRSNPTPDEIDRVAADLDAAGLSATAAQLRAIAAERRRGGTAIPPAPASTAPPPPPPAGTPAAPAPASTAPPPPPPAPAPAPASTPAPAPSPPARETLAEELARAERELGPVQGPIARQRYDEAMRTTAVAPAEMRTIAAQLRERGYPRIAESLEGRAAELEAAGPSTPAASTVTPPPPPPAPSTPAAPYTPAVPETPAAPPPGAVATPEPVTSPTTEAPPTPATASTYNPTRARSLASRVAENIRSRGYSYNRADVRSFQEAAGLTADGIYGGTTRAALVHFGVRRPPSALFAPTTGTYTPPA